jgi:hypothetical protein
MNNSNQIELNNNLEYWYGYIDANLVNYNRINISNVSLDNTTMEMFITDTETQFCFDFYKKGQVVGKHKIFIGNNQLEFDWNLQFSQELIKMFKSIDIKNQISI